MGQYDILYAKQVENIAENGEYDNDGKVRTVYKDGSPAYTKSVFGVQMRMDGSEPPIVTTKKVFAVTAYREMWLFWVMQTVLQDFFEEYRVKVWDEWFNKERNLGRSYAYQFESHRHHVREIVKIKPRIKERHGEIAHDESRTNSGIGYLGNSKSVKNYTKEQYQKLRNKWKKMISRCYNVNDKDYSLYGGAGIFVEERWHSFENYLRDVRYIPQFFLAKENNFDGYEIDKDYYGSNCYSIETCVWLSSRENRTYRNLSKPFMLVHPDGNKELFIDISKAEDKYGLKNISCILRGAGKKSSKGFTAEYIEEDGYVYRYEVSKNQVVELLKGIKSNPYSRRLETNFWNFADSDKKVLQECAFSTQWNVRNGRLDLLLRQRSADIGLGVVFNAIQYHFLHCMVAQVSGLEVGTFTHQIGNLHYYDRHEQPLLEQIKNESYDAPRVWVNPEVFDFFDFTESDVRLVNYKCGDYVPMEVAI
jgi:thymidylate synthase